MARPVPTHPAVACGDVPEFDISLIILLIGIRLQQIRNAGCLFRIVVRHIFRYRSRLQCGLTGQRCSGGHDRQAG